MSHWGKGHTFVTLMCGMTRNSIGGERENTTRPARRATTCPAPHTKATIGHCRMTHQTRQTCTTLHISVKWISLHRKHAGSWNGFHNMHRTMDHGTNAPAHWMFTPPGVCTTLMPIASATRHTLRITSDTCRHTTSVASMIGSTDCAMREWR